MKLHNPEKFNIKLAEEVLAHIEGGARHSQVNWNQCLGGHAVHLAHDNDPYSGTYDDPTEARRLLGLTGHDARKLFNMGQVSFFYLLLLQAFGKLEPVALRRLRSLIAQAKAYHLKQARKTEDARQTVLDTQARAQVQAARHGASTITVVQAQELQERVMGGCR